MNKKWEKLWFSNQTTEFCICPDKLTKGSRFSTGLTLGENMGLHSHKYHQALHQSKCQKNKNKKIIDQYDAVSTALDRL